MATNFIHLNLEHRQYVPTSSVSSIRAYTDKERIDVSLVCENGLNGEVEVFFSTQLYAFNNIVELTDVGSLIEEYFRKRNKVYDIISIEFDDIAMDVHFLYCECIIPEFDPNSCFFIASHVQRVHQDSTISLSAVNHGSATPFTIKAVGHRASDDVLGVVSGNITRDFNREGIVYFAVSDIVRWAMNMTDEKVAEPLRDVLYFSIEYCGLQKMCYIVPATAYLTFSFRNIFNVEEYIDVVGVMTTKTEVSRDTAVCNGIAKQYNRSIDRTYQIRTEPLTADDVAVFEQFIASHSVTLWHEKNDYNVIITDHTCEPATDNDALTTIQFTWRFTDRRPHIFNSVVNGVMPTRRKIFNETFSPEYE